MVYYKPEDGVSADYIPFYWDGEFQLFYLKDYRDRERCGEGTPWCRVSTKDFIHFTDHGEMLPRGTEDEQDLYVFTGSVIRAEGLFHIFYTGHNPHLRAAGKPEQAVMHAISDDLDHWTKIPEDTFYASAELGYEPHDWRDPFVFYDDARDEYRMLLAARRLEGPAIRRGVTACCASKDLKTWRVEKPVWAPESYFTHECPDLFKIGDWYYLIYSEFTDQCRTRYVMSKSIDGEWHAPADDVFDTRAYYAAKSFSDGNARYLFGWHATRERDSDAGNYQWGGNLVVHKLEQRADGTLSVREPETIAAQWCPAGTHEDIVLDKANGMCMRTLSNALSEPYRMTCEVRYKAGTRAFGLRLRGDEKADSGYGLIFHPDASLLAMDYLPNPQWGSMNTHGMTRIVVLSPDTPVRLTLTVEGTMETLYVNDDTAFTGRIYDLRGLELACFVQHGTARFENIRFFTL